MTSSDSGTLYTLGDRGQTINGSTNDVRGREVKDKNSNSIGKVTDLLIDDREQKVRFLLVEHGGLLGFGKTKTLIPVDAITKITQNEVLLDQTRERVTSAPGYDPDLADDRPYHSNIYGYYGYGPFWNAGYMYPLAMLPTSPPQSQN
jgi:sporulation protein YlmC with PRC-barrel domain